MDIRNVTQFCNFLTSSGVVQMNPAFQQVVNCVQNYAAACNCHKTQDKQALYIECNKLYNQCIMGIIPSIKYAVLQKVPDGRLACYSDNGTLLTIISRN